MEAWMADPTLNANAKVVRWHESQQKAGFKFLVTEIMGYMTGGPQKYTGRPMEEAHMHLAISAAEWRQFMRVAEKTFERTAVPVGARRELGEILEGFQMQCVLPEGHAPPPDPGAPRPHPSTLGTTFQRLGGVYPIAQFADRLVDLLLSDRGRAVGVAFEDIDSPDARRHPPGIKYLLTELLLSAAGGPEVVTAKEFEEAKLGVPTAQWAAFCAVAADAAAFFPTPYHRAMILDLISGLRPELCIGDGAGTDGASADTSTATIEAAGFQRFDAVAALYETGGDAERALDKLVSGWRPEGVAAEMAAADSAAPRCPFGGGRLAGGGKENPGAPKCPFDFGGAGGAGGADGSDAPRCPFGFGGGAAATNRPPAEPPLPPQLMATVKTMAERGGLGAEEIATMLQLDAKAVAQVLHPEQFDAGGGVAVLPPGLAEAARTMAERGIDAEQIAGMLKVDVEAVKATVASTTAAANTGGKVVGTGAAAS